MNLLDRLLALSFGEHSGRIIGEDGSVLNLYDAFDTLGGFSTYTELQHAIHSGNAYSLSLLSTVAGGATKYFLITTGAKDMHLMEALLDSDGGGLEIRLFEGATVSANGTARSFKNLRRIAPMNTSVATVHEGPTVTTEGEELAVGPIYGTNKTPASSTIAGGRVLAPNTKHLIAVKNVNGSGTIAFGMTLLVHDHALIA